MADKPQVILSGFADEAAYHKTAVEQFAPLAALGMQYYSLRAIDAGRGIKNVLLLTTAEIQKIRHQEDEYDHERRVDRFADRQSEAARC